MATYTAEASSVLGTALTQRSAASGDKINPDQNLMLIVSNGSGGSINLTITVPGNNAYSQANPDPVIAIGAGVTKAILLLRDWADPTDGTIALSWSATTTVTFYVVRA